MNLDILRPGDDARCAGTVVQTRTGYAVLRFDVDSPPRDDLHTVHWSSSWSVDISLAKGGEAAFVGAPVEVVGVWTGTGITAGRASAVVPPPPTVTVYTPEDPAISRDLGAEQIRRAIPDVLLLLDEGVLVSHSRTAAEAHVIAHDVDRAEEVLRPHYGDALTVRPSPFPPSVFRLVDDLSTLADSENVLVAHGGDHDFDENTTFIEVSHVTVAMKVMARDLPDGAVAVIAQATAAPTS